MMRAIIGCAVGMVAAALLLTGCSAGSEASDAPRPGDPAAGSTGPESSSTPPTMARPTAPPTAPTDVPPSGVVAGRVSALAEGCTEVTTDDGEVWSLTGSAPASIAVDDTVRAKVADLDPGESACGSGRGARMVSIELVGSAEG
ncbi:hypothetical protein ACDF64_05995 [Agromyces sp. MMS24-JH15]|uniref:hypothetical protein n=1 Tax=Agromyces sp. MMS24-JH15 TaxID=3243765 RepID=UPI0037493133